MSGLSASLSIATQALMANEAAINGTTNNIANINTPGYTRKRVVLTEAASYEQGSLVVGNGVALQGFESVRDRLLELRIQDQTQEQGSAQSQLGALQQVEALFSSADLGVGADLSAFFNSLQALSTDPASSPKRQNVLTAAQNLASSFQTSAANLLTMQRSVNEQVSGTVDQIDQLSQQIASLNSQIGSLQGSTEGNGALGDQRSELILQLSELVDVTAVPSDQGETLITRSGAQLVVGSQSFALEVSTDATGTQRVLSQGADITDRLVGGQLGGLVKVRDTVVPNFLGQLNTMAGEFASAFNAAHHAGLTSSGTAGGDFFSAPTGANDALHFAVLVSSPEEIAASSDGSVGSNGNVATLLAVKQAAQSSGQSASGAYSSLVANIGNATAQAKRQVQVGDLALQQLSNQRSAVSGVSLDEEAANLVRYQQAFQAAARVVSTIDELTQVLLGMGAR